jgi:hypothetical protein
MIRKHHANGDYLLLVVVIPKWAALIIRFKVAVLVGYYAVARILELSVGSGEK